MFHFGRNGYRYLVALQQPVSQSAPVIPNDGYASYEDDWEHLSNTLGAPDFICYLCAIWKDEDIMVVAHD